VPILEVRHAVTLLERGDSLGATRLAAAAIEAGVPTLERAVAEGVLRGELPAARQRVTAFSIAAVLPQGGPPGLAEFARLVSEGIEVAAATVLGEPYQVTVVPRDSQGDPSMAAGLVSELETEGFAGAVGFLEDETLLAAGPARQRALPIVSPTARNASLAGEGIYSLEGPDPEAAATLARYAASRAHQRVAIILPETQTANEEAAAFEAEAARLGVLVVGRYPYTPQATFFESQILGARDALRAAEIVALGLAPEDTLRVEMLEPVAIFLPIPTEDVEYVAPQLAHFALDTLAIEIMGTSGWTDPQVLRLLEPRYLDGVVATATVGTGAPGSAGLSRFREAYERHFQRTLVSPTPAIGYDAALLLLEALRPGRLGPEDMRSSFEALSDVEGATGIFSVANDRIVRRTQLVRIDRRQLVPISPY
jgi:ABC-type branched-subunit amino acid transport system substrate-binding protein